MPRAPWPLPDDLVDRPILVGAGQVPPSRLRRRDVWAPHHGVRIVTGSAADWQYESGAVAQGAEARPETLLRLRPLDGGLPEPRLNVDIRSSSGSFLGRGDLVYEEYRVVVEYDGDQHRTDTLVFDRDVLRLDGLAAAGWRVVRVTGRAFFGSPTATVHRVRRALVDAGWSGATRDIAATGRKTSSQ